MLPGPPGPGWQGQSSPKALPGSAPLGWAEVTHPYHPLRGQRFPVLKTRRVSGVDTLIVRGTTGGTYALARDWTDLADPSPYTSAEASPHLRFDCLLALAELVRKLDSPERKGA